MIAGGLLPCSSAEAASVTAVRGNSGSVERVIKAPAADIFALPEAFQHPRSASWMGPGGLIGGRTWRYELSPTEDGYRLWSSSRELPPAAAPGGLGLLTRGFTPLTPTGARRGGMLAAAVPLHVR
jgi:hypothetical protein